MNIILERLFVIGAIVKPHIVMVALYVYLSACSTAIAEPSTVKEPTTPPGNERPKVLNSGLKGCKMGTEETIDVVGPYRGVGEDGTKLGQDSRAKGRTGSGTTRLEVVTPSEMSANSSHEQRGRNGNDIRGYEVYEFFHGVLFAVLFAWSIIFLGNAANGVLKHNKLHLASSIK